MGSGRDKRKKAKGGNKPGGGAEKTARKSEKNESKQARRAERKTQGGEDDIDALLAQFKLMDAENNAVKIQEGVRVSPRVYSSFTLIPSQKENELVLFGGEWYDSDRDKTHVYADLFVFNTDKAAWRKIMSPKGPLPRSSHQAVATKHHLYVFGGEFTSLNQEKFRHYSDLWRLSFADWRWEQLPIRGGPSARSGHRMLLHRGRLVLFGGFWDAGKEPRYYNDLWTFDLEELRWECLGPGAPGASWPSPRGGCQLALQDDTMFVFGGFSIVKEEKPKDALLPGGKRKGSRREEEEDEGKAVVHDDIWSYDFGEGGWQRVKKAGMAPSPRTGFGLVTHRKRAIYFGGVQDRAGARDRVYSELFNELYQFDMATRRWFPLAMRAARKPAAPAAEAATAEAGPDEETSATTGAAPASAASASVASAISSSLTEEQRAALHRAATTIQARYRGYAVRKAYVAYKLGGAVSELLYSPALYGVDVGASAATLRPRARGAPALVVARGTLWLLGGVVEVAHTDVVLDDLWSLNLAKLDGWTCVLENTTGEAIDRGGSDWETDASDEESSDDD